MPVDITENYVRIRQHDPGDFDSKSFKTIWISKPKGIKAIIGKPKGEKSTKIQSYLFDKKKWSEKEAKKWIKEHGGTINAYDFDVFNYGGINSLEQLHVAAEFLYANQDWIPKPIQLKWVDDLVEKEKEFGYAIDHVLGGIMLIGEMTKDELLSALNASAGDSVAKILQSNTEWETKLNAVNSDLAQAQAKIAELETALAQSKELEASAKNTVEKVSTELATTKESVTALETKLADASASLRLYDRKSQLKDVGVDFEKLGDKEKEYVKASDNDAFECFVNTLKLKDAPVVEPKGDPKPELSDASGKLETVVDTKDKPEEKKTGRDLGFLTAAMQKRTI